MASTRFNIWLDTEKLELLKRKAKKDNRSTSSWIRCKLFEDEYDK